MKILLFLILSFTITIVSLSQDNNFNRSPVTLPSPDAAQFIRYGDVPVDYSTGVPNISIPLYKVTCGNLSIPIDISYNASGIKVLDVAGTVGLGWNLNAGGLVSRTILGTDDQRNYPKPFLSSSDVYNQRSQCSSNLSLSCVQTLVETFNDAFLQRKETQSDRYFYSFNGRSGIFRSDFQTGVIKTIPYSPLKISTGINNAGPYKITTEDGTNYYFEQAEFSGSFPDGNAYNMSYYLTKIESPDLTHAINIYYKKDDGVSQFIKTYELEHKIDISNSSTAYPNVITTQIHDNEFTNSTTPVMPDSITSDNETLLFQYIADRPDLRKSRLYRINVLNRITRDIIKTIEFQFSYFGTASANNQRLRLDNLYIKGNDSKTVQQYGFSYNSTPLPPYYRQVGMSERHNVDYWGYYNAADNLNLLPSELFDPTTSNFTLQEKAFYGGNRNPNSATAQACTLTEITYPTGGKTNFEYELNKVSNGYSYTSSPEGDDFGGLRVNKITSTADFASPPIIRTYKYAGWFHTIIEPELYVYTKESTRFGPQSTGTTNQTGTILSSFISTDPFISMTTGRGALAIYDNVTEYYGTEFNNNGYIQYLYDNSSIPYQIYDPGTSGNPHNNGSYLIDYGNYIPQLIAKVFHGKDQNNNDKELKREEYTYNNFNSGTFITGLKLTRNVPFIKTGDYAPLTDCDAICFYTANCQSQLPSLLSYCEAINTIGVLDIPLLVQKKETIHSSTGIGDLITTTNYSYDLVTLQPIKEQVSNSKGDNIISVNKYPTDFSSVPPYNTMATRNILTTVVEQLVYKNTISNQNFLKSTKTNYNFWNGNNWSSLITNIIVPNYVETKQSTSSSETRLQYNSYNTKGNIVDLSKSNDIHQVYLYGYNSTYPVAKIIGTTYDVAKAYVTQSVLDNPTDDATLRNHLNNLRTIPKVFVTTYTYKPLIGMTSLTDTNGRTTYFEYDGFGRLKIIRDHDNKIIKKICYNYTGQPESCAN